MTIFKRIHDFVDALFELIGDTLLLLMRRVAPFLVILPPAFFLAHAVAAAAEIVAGPRWGLAVGVTAAVALEAAGMYAPFQATQLFKRRESFWWVPAVGALVYVGVGVAVIWIVEGITYDAKVVGTAMYIIALLVYVMLGLDTYISTVRRDEQTERTNELELEKARITADAEVRKERAWAKASSAEPANVRRTSGERPANVPDYDAVITEIRRTSDGQYLSVADVQEMTGRGRTAAYDLLSYGVDTGQIERAGRGQYKLNGVH